MGKKGPTSSSSSSSGGGKKGDASSSKGAAPAPAAEEGGPKKRPPKGHRQKGAGAVIADKGGLCWVCLAQRWASTTDRLFCLGSLSIKSSRPIPSFSHQHQHHPHMYIYIHNIHTDPIPSPILSS
jgi:hypothetical protein